MRIHVVVHPRSKHPKVVKNTEGVLHIYTTAVPEQGKANQAAQKAVAEYMDAPVSQVVLVRGHASRKKEFVVKLRCE